MVTDLFRASILERFRKRKSGFGSVTLTLFLAGWLNLLVQPYLMAAPSDDCLESTVHHQTILLSGSTANRFDHSVLEFTFLVNCKSMQGCADWDGAYLHVPSLELEKKFLASTVSPAQIQSGPVSFDPQLIHQEFPFSGVSLFIQNCAFLI